MEHLLSAWPDVVARLSSAENILLLSDFDGTLAPIVARPELAYLPEQTKRTLQQVAERDRYVVGIISGRAMHDLKQRIGLDGVIYAGNCGLEIEGPRLRLVNPAARERQPLLRDLYRQLDVELKAIEGVVIENKDLSLSVHYRLVATADLNEMRKVFRRLTRRARAQGSIQVTSGKKVYEIAPAIEWHKGKVIDLLLKEYAKRGKTALPIFLGDDVVDEGGFEAADRHGGISVFIGDKGHASIARYFLRSPDEARQFLEKLP